MTTCGDRKEGDGGGAGGGGGRRNRIRIPPRPPSTLSNHRHHRGPESSPQLNSRHHYCPFCLQQESQEEEEKVTDKNPVMTVTEIQPIINYLTRAGTEADNVNNGNRSHDDDGDGRTSQEDFVKNGVPVTVPNCLPLKMMCPSCHDLLTELGRLHRELLRIQWLIQKQTEMTREMITNGTRVEGRSAASLRERFNSEIRSTGGMSAEEVAAVTKFVDELHSKITPQGSNKKKVRFPAYLPEDFVPEAQPPLKSYQQLQRQLPRCSVRLSRCDDLVMSGIKTGSISSSPPGSPGAFDSISDSAEADFMPPQSTNDRVKGNDLSVIKDETEQAEVRERNLLGVLAELVAEIKKDTVKLVPVPSPPEERGEEEYFRSPDDRRISTSSSSPSPPEAVTPRKTNRKRKLSTESDAHPPKKTNSRKMTTGKTILKKKMIRKRPQLILPLVMDGNSTSQYCDLCKELCPSSEIRSHLESKHHVQDFIATCPNPTCPYIFSSPGKLERHLGEGTWATNKCRRKAKLPSIFPLKTCQVCSFQAKFMLQFRMHLESHESTKDVQEKVLRCPIPECNKQYALRQSLEVHIFTHDCEDDRRRSKTRRMVDGVLVYVVQTCDLCGVKVPIADIVNHLDEAHHVKDYIRKCPNPACGKVFSCRGKLERHLTHRSSTNSDCQRAINLPKRPSTIKCEACNKEVSRNRFLNHLQRHEYQEKDKSLSCPIPGCLDRYSLKQSLEEHIFSHDLRPPKKSTQECSLCRQLIKLEDVANHLREAHEVEDPICCQRCPLLFHDWESLLEHLYIHRLRGFTGGGGGLSCDLCKDAIGIKFMRYDKLREHFFREHNIGKQFSCEDCDMEFFSQRALSQHRKKTHPSKEADMELEPAKVSKKTFQCDLCPDVAYIKKDSLLSHKIRVHGAPPIPCNFCSEVFTSLSNLHQHERQEHLGLRKPFKCNVEGCGRIFQNMAYFRRHKRSAHNTTPGSKLHFICETCGRGYNLKESLTYHVNSAHLGKRRPRRICEICGESFATTTTLRIHALTHTLERPHQCSICGQAFRQKDVLQTHLKLHAEKGDSFKPNGPMKSLRRRVVKN